jgi:hypothetical protein
MMIAGASVSFFKPEFGDFLYALIGSDEDKGHLTVLSALSRLDIDPWKEAAELSALPVDTAAGRLASVIAQLPGRSWTKADAKGIADRLVGLLPRDRGSHGSSAAKPAGVRGITPSTAMLVCIAIALAVAVVATSISRSTQGSDSDGSARLTTDVPQTLPR